MYFLLKMGIFPPAMLVYWRICFCGCLEGFLSCGKEDKMKRLGTMRDFFRPIFCETLKYDEICMI